MSDFSGLSIDRYHILNKIGQGGMATIYSAFDSRLEQEVAIKFLRFDDLPKPTADRMLKRFNREARETSRINHPNIVAVIDYGEYDGQPYLVMPLLKGGNLRDFLQKQEKPVFYQVAAGILSQIAYALNYAHKNGIVHRDIKPENILFTEDGKPMITDFGIARITDVDRKTTTLTMTGIAVGTPKYMAPEQWTSSQVDLAADIYSLGIILFEMIAGKSPFPGSTLSEIMMNSIKKPLPRMIDLGVKIPKSVEQVIHKATAKNPEERFKSMGEFAGLLEKISKNEPVNGISLPKLPGSKKNNHIRRKIRITISLFSVSFIGLVSIIFLNQYDFQSNNLKLSSLLTPVFIPSYTITSKRTCTPTAKIISTITPTASLKATSTSTATKTQTPEEIRPETIAQLAEVRKLDPYVTIQNAAFHPNSLRFVIFTTYPFRIIEYGSGIYSIGKEKIKGSTISNTGITYTYGDIPHVVYYADLNPSNVTLMGNKITSIAYSPDGKLYATGSNLVRLWNIETDSVINTLSGSGTQSGVVSKILFSPDSKLLVSVTDDVIHFYEIYEDGAHSISYLTKDNTNINDVAFSPDGSLIALAKNDGTVQVWSYPDEILMYTLIGHVDIVCSLSFTDNGLILASGSEDKTIRFWDVSEGALLRTISGDYGIPAWMDFTKYDKYLAVIYKNPSEVIVWGIQN